MTENIVCRTFSDIGIRDGGAYSKADREYANNATNWLINRYGFDASQMRSGVLLQKLEGYVTYAENKWVELISEYTSLQSVKGEAHQIHYYKFGEVGYWDADLIDDYNIDHHDIVIVFPDVASAIEFKLSVG